MAVFSSNILPTYPLWSFSGSITQSASSLSSSSNGAYAYWDYVQSNVHLGGLAQITTAGCTGTWYLVLFFFNQDIRDNHSIILRIPQNAHTFTITLPDITVGNLRFRVVHRGTSSGTCGAVTFQYESTSTKNSGYEDADTLIAGGSRTFRSFTTGRTNIPVVADLYYGNEITVATLNIGLDTKLVTLSNAASIFISGAVSFQVQSGHADTLLARLYFGDRMLSQEEISVSTVYQELTHDISATIHVSSAIWSDLCQNIPLILTISRGQASSATGCKLLINNQQSFISATGPIVLHETRGYVNLSSNVVSSSTPGLLSFCPYYYTQERWPSSIYITLPTTPIVVCRLDYTNSDWVSDQRASVVATVVHTFDSTVKKARVVRVTQTLKVPDPTEVTALSGSSFYYVVLTTSNQLQVRNSSNSTLYTIASGVVDFDTTLCGLYGQNVSTKIFENLFMGGAYGFTVFYTTGSALFVASYPKFDTPYASINTAPTLSASGIYSIEIPSGITNISAINVSALYQVTDCWRSDHVDGAYGCCGVLFGITFKAGTDWYYGKVECDIPVGADSSGYPIVVSDGYVIKCHLVAAIPTRYQTIYRYDEQGHLVVVHEGRTVYAETVTSINRYYSGSVQPLGTPITNATANLGYRTLFGITTVGNTYYDTFWENIREFSCSSLSGYIDGATSEAFFMAAPSMYVKLHSSADIYAVPEYCTDMLASGDAACLYVGIGNPDLSPGSSKSTYYIQFSRGILPRIQYFFEGTDNVNDMLSMYYIIGSTLTHTGSGANSFYTTQFTEQYSTLASVMQVCLTEEIYPANRNAYTALKTYYGYLKHGQTTYVGTPTGWSSGVYTIGFISDIAPADGNDNRAILQNDLYYNGWTPYVYAYLA